MEKRMYRSRNKKVIAGIGGGLGDYLDIDPVILRIIFVLITIFNGIGILVYIIMWIVIPEEPLDVTMEENSKKSEFASNNNTQENTASVEESEKDKSKASGGRIVFGVILILIGLVFLSERFFPFLDFEFVFAAGLIALGLAMVFNFFNKTEKLK